MRNKVRGEAALKLRPAQRAYLAHRAPDEPVTPKVRPSSALSPAVLRSTQTVSTEKSKLYYGDNLDVLRRYVKDESVDLVYLDPPFNPRQDYNVLFAEKDGSQSSSQIHAFEDTWEWNTDAMRAYEQIVEQGSLLCGGTYPPTRSCGRDVSSVVYLNRKPKWNA